MRNPTIHFVFLFPFLFLVLVPAPLFAIHAIFEDGEPIQRKHGPIFLRMPIELFLQTVDGEEEATVKGQFKHERQFRLEGTAFRSGVASAVTDFYRSVLYRLQINFRPVDKAASPIPKLTERWSHRHGPPRSTALPGVDLFFWDDGKTRMILEVDHGETTLEYSLTYIDDDLFHHASRDRVQIETDGESTYKN
jgi:hypothetical protein